MKHHQYLQELVEQEYLVKTPIHCQDTGKLETNLLTEMAESMLTLQPMFFQGALLETGKAIYVAGPVAVEDEQSSVYLFPDTEQIIVSRFADMREDNPNNINAVFSVGVLGIGEEDLIPLPEKAHATFTFLDDKIIKITQKMNQHILKDIYNSAVICAYQLASLELLSESKYLN